MAPLLLHMEPEILGLGTAKCKYTLLSVCVQGTGGFYFVCITSRLITESEAALNSSVCNISEAKARQTPGQLPSQRNPKATQAYRIYTSPGTVVVVCGEWLLSDELTVVS